MLEAINDGLRRFGDFRGRSNKLQYNSFLLFFLVINFFVTFVNPKGILVNNIIMAALTVPLIAAEIRRAHDVGKSGWWILVPFFSLYLMFKNSVPEEPWNIDSL